MRYDRFEQLPVWQAASVLAVRVFSLGQTPAIKQYRPLRDQIERAALSISSNIAEGFERGTTKELVTFLYIARGSAGEVRSILCVAERLDGFADFKSEISNLKSAVEQISRQLRAWAQSLQDSNIEGQRYLTAKTRARYTKQREREAFIRELGPK